MELHRYWFRFDLSIGQDSHGVLLGCGVTVFSYDDAIQLLERIVFKEQPLPNIKEFIEDVDVSRLDAKHVLPNIVGNPKKRGVWFPQGYDYAQR